MRRTLFLSELLKTVKSGAVDHADMISDGCTNKWSFLSSYYFVGTVVTTLGCLKSFIADLLIYFQVMEMCIQAPTPEKCFASATP